MKRPPPWLLVTGLVAVLWSVLALAAQAGLFAAHAAALPRALAGWWAALVWTLLQIGCGRTLLGTVHRSFGARGEERGLTAVMFSWSAGAFVLGLVLLALALLQALDAPRVLVMALLLAVPAWRGLRALATPRPLAPSVPHAALLAALLLAWALPYLVQTCLPNTDWDGEVYHLPLALRFAAGRVADTDPYLPHFNFPGGVSLVYAAFLVLDLEAAVIPLNFIASALLPLAVLALGRELWSLRVGVWSAAVVASLNLVWELGLDPRIDGFLCLHVLVAVHAFLAFERERTRASLLTVMALALSGAIGCKYTALLPVLVLGLPTLWLVLRARGSGAPAVRRTFALALVLLCLPSGLWLVRNAVQLGDPVYPLLDRYLYHRPDGVLARFEPDLLATLQQLPPVPPSYLAVAEPDVPRHLWNVVDVLLHADRYENKPHHDLSPWLFLAFLAPLWVRGRSAVWLFVLALGIHAPLASKGNLVRHALPGLPLLALAAGLLLERLRQRWQVALVAAGIAGSLALAAVSEWRKLPRLRSAAFLLGGEDRLDWLCEAGFNRETSMPRMIREINRAVAAGVIAADTTILMVGESKGRLLRCGHLPDEGYQGYRWLVELVRAGGDLARIRTSLRQRGIEYLLVNRGYLGWVIRNVPRRRERIASMLWSIEQFEQRFGTVIARNDALELVRLR